MLGAKSRESKHKMEQLRMMAQKAAIQKACFKTVCPHPAV